MAHAISAADLGINLGSGGEKALFKWLIASLLMGKRIQAGIAAEAYHVIVDKHAVDTPRKLSQRSHRELVGMLGEGHYSRYDESTAERLSSLAAKLNSDYAGKVTSIREASSDLGEFKQRLQAFDGIGPKTVEIFMRDAEKAL
ncbi:DNA methylase [Pseudomonas typographi]|uniref:DNA methylase n=1 Tax=Pseudomonas typographi TaxID=2715964 RepID=A0ABR7YZS1_9PSED|nr:DNA methylase [Pseudomonas typographi]MBD1586816.1 DNA methylase [Pseudomonas typographi]MBD1598710.1 DNA methylase [Pseudomonas typographi]